MPAPDRGLARHTGSGGRAKPGPASRASEAAAGEEARRQQSSERIRGEHANAGHKQRRSLQRYIGRREDDDETRLAIAGLVSSRAAER
ncbi:hypothetical protein [Streptomyces sp. NPDC090021]|uniref:hypothetical protein n=1 Tax=Streptomyces sp. NPDC090021 TaxID=3365919 RepID=UPI0038025397